MTSELKEKIRAVLPWTILYLYRKIRSLPEDLPVIVPFLFSGTKTPTTFFERLRIVYKCYRISYSVESPHMENEMLRVISAIFSIPPSTAGVVVEAGSYKGGSTAKLSLAAELAGRKLIVFDSFEGLPENQEAHGKNIFGGDAYFPAGSYAGSLEEVRKNVARFGKLEVCEFRKGWFENTMTDLNEPVCTAYVDVDLESSTRTCLHCLYPLLVPNGLLFSQDGHLPLIIKLLSDDEFWKKEIGQSKPQMIGLGKQKLVAVIKNVSGAL
jgi:O-methyltransferase